MGPWDTMGYSIFRQPISLPRWMLKKHTIRKVVDANLVVASYVYTRICWWFKHVQAHFFWFWSDLIGHSHSLSPCIPCEGHHPHVLMGSHADSPLYGSGVSILGVLRQCPCHRCCLGCLFGLHKFGGFNEGGHQEIMQKGHLVRSLVCFNL